MILLMRKANGKRYVMIKIDLDQQSLTIVDIMNRKSPKYFICLFFILFLSVYGSLAHDMTFNPEPMRAIVNEHRDYFIEKIQDIPTYTHSSDELIAFLERVNSGSFSEAKWTKMVKAATSSEGLLTVQPEEVELLVAALACRYDPLFNYSLNRLMWKVCHESRKPYAEQIKQALGGCPELMEAKWLLAKCGLTEEEQEKLLQSDHGENLVLRALCNEPKAEEQLISNFEGAITYSEKELWVKPLAFVGSEPCSKALIDGLASTIFTAGRSYRSIRDPILRVLGLIYEDQFPLFEAFFDGGGNEAVEKLDQWVRESYGHPVWTNRCIFINVPRYFDTPCTCVEKVSADETTALTNTLFPEAQSTPLEQKDNTWKVDLGDGVSMEFVPINPGRFRMGSDDYDINEMPIHMVTLRRPYWVAKTEVTQAQFQQITGVYRPESTINGIPEEKRGNYPVDTVSRQDAYDFCRKLTERERKAGRLPENYEFTLPTEAQWEYACRAGSREFMVTDMTSLAWFDEPILEGIIPSAHPVGTKQPNEWGLYDMLGNVVEWCSDCYHDTYHGAPADESRWGGGSHAVCYGVVRGGAVTSSIDYCHPSYRQPLRTAFGVNSVLIGFRPILQEVPEDNWMPSPNVIPEDIYSTLWGDKLSGSFCDLKQTPEGELTTIGRNVALSNASGDEFMQTAEEDAAEAIRVFLSDWNRGKLKDYFKNSNYIGLNFLAVTVRADRAPETLFALDRVDPLFWICTYKGRIAAPENGRYRFCGFADDVLIVRVNGKLVLDACSSDREGLFSEWKSRDANNRKFPLKNGHTAIGDWISLKQGAPVDIEILTGDISGDTYSVALLIEQEGKEYRMLQTSAGMHPVLPLFKITELSDELVDLLDMNPDQVNVDGPIFGVRANRTIVGDSP